MLDAPEGGRPLDGAAGGRGTSCRAGETSSEETPEEEAIELPEECRPPTAPPPGSTAAYGNRDDVDEVEVREKREADVEAVAGPDDDEGA